VKEEEEEEEEEENKRQEKKPRWVGQSKRHSLAYVSNVFFPLIFFYFVSFPWPLLTGPVEQGEDALDGGEGPGVHRHLDGAQIEGRLARKLVRGECGAHQQDVVLFGPSKTRTTSIQHKSA
jgi:hypothetical protein